MSLVTSPTTTASGVVARVAAYWIVHGGVVLWAAAIARRHGLGGCGQLARGMVTTLVGLWILGSPVIDVLGGGYRPGWFLSFLVLVPFLLILVTFQRVIAAVMDLVTWLAVRREWAGDWSWILSAGLAVGTSVLLWRSILGVAHPHAAATLTILAGVVQPMRFPVVV